MPAWHTFIVLTGIALARAATPGGGHAAVARDAATKLVAVALIVDAVTS
jgi:hypothetical protein